jgi:hypothetical protein
LYIDEYRCVYYGMKRNKKSLKVSFLFGLAKRKQFLAAFLYCFPCNFFTAKDFIQGMDYPVARLAPGQSGHELMPFLCKFIFVYEYLYSRHPSFLIYIFTVSFCLQYANIYMSICIHDPSICLQYPYIYIIHLFTVSICSSMTSHSIGSPRVELGQANIIFNIPHPSLLLHVHDKTSRNAILLLIQEVKSDSIFRKMNLPPSAQQITDHAPIDNPLSWWNTRKLRTCCCIYKNLTSSEEILKL